MKNVQTKVLRDVLEGERDGVSNAIFSVELEEGACMFIRVGVHLLTCKRGCTDDND